MRIQHVAAAAALCVACTATSAAVLLSEGFDDVGALAGAGWVTQNLSTPGGSGLTWFQGNDGIFGSHAGAPTSYIASNFDTAGFGGVLDNWLFTPQVSLANATTLALQVRSSGVGILDTLEIYYSTNGGSTATGDFTLLDTYTNTNDQAWAAQVLNVAATGGSGRFAFRYVSSDTSVAGDYIGIDSLSITSRDPITVPTPGSLALAGLALAALAATGRHRRA